MNKTTKTLALQRLPLLGLVEQNISVLQPFSENFYSLSLSLCLHSPHCCNSPLRCFFSHNVWFHFLYSSYDSLPFLLQKLSQPTPHREGHVSNVSSSFQTLVYALFSLKYFLGLDGIIHFIPKIHFSPFVWCPENCPIRTYTSYLPCHLSSSLFHPDHRTKWRDHPYLPPSGHRFSGTRSMSQLLLGKLSFSSSS